MEIGQVKGFLAVAEELHFGRAATRLNMSQPPLSRAIQALESEVGTALLERTSRRVRLTPAGEAFRREAVAMVARMDAALAAARNASVQSEGNVTIGFVGAATYSFLPRFALILRDRLPGLSVRFVEAVSVAQIENLRLSRIDLALVRPVDGISDLSSMPVVREGLAMAIPHQHPLARRQRPRVASLNGEPFIGFSTDAPYLRNHVSEILRQHRTHPRVIQEFAQSQAILSLVSAGLGIAIVPECTASACFDNVTFRPLGRAVRSVREGASIDLLAVWSQAADNPAVEAVIGVLKGFVTSEEPLRSSRLSD